MTFGFHIVLAKNGIPVLRDWLGCLLAVSVSFFSFISFKASIHTFVCSKMSDSGLIRGNPDQLPSASAHCKINQVVILIWLLRLCPPSLFIFAFFSLGQDKQTNQ